MHSLHIEIVRFLRGRSPQEKHDADDKKELHIILQYMNDIRNFLKYTHDELEKYVGDEPQDDRTNRREEPIERQQPSQRKQEEESIADLFSDAQNTMRSFYNEMIRFLAGRNPREIYDVDDKEAFHLIRLQMNDIRNFLKVMHAQLKEYVGDKHRGD